MAVLKRVVWVHWKHRVNEELEFKKMGDIGPPKKIYIDKNKQYDVDGLISALVVEYCTKFNKTIFDDSLVQLADPRSDNDNFLKEFVDADNQPCDYWVFREVHLPRDQTHRCKILLLTTKLREKQNCVELKKATTEKSPNKNFESRNYALKDRDPNCMYSNKDLHRISLQPPEHKRLPTAAFQDESRSNVNSKKAKIFDLTICSENQKLHEKNVSLAERNAAKFSKKNIITTSKTSSQKLSVGVSLSRQLHKSTAEAPLDGYFKIPEVPRQLAQEHEKKSKRYTQSVVEYDQNLSYNHSSSLKTVVNADLGAGKFSTKRWTLNERIEYLKSLNVKIPLINFGELEEIEDLGCGGQASVTKYKWKGAYYAVKSYNLNDNELYVAREIAGLAQANHPNIVQIMGISLSEDHYHIMTGVANGRNLDTLIQEPVKLDLNTKDLIGEQIAAAVTYLHLELPNKPSIIHRDIKPGNVIVSQLYQVKLCDFGLCKFQGLPDKLTSGIDIIAGTALYLSPNQLLQGQKATLKSDVWSLACTLLELYSEDDVWEINFRLSIAEQVKKQMLENKKPKLALVPLYLWNTLDRCFNWDENLRPDAEKVLKAYEAKKWFD